MKLPVLLVFTIITLASEFSFAFNMGPLNQYLESGSFGAWKVTDQDGAAIFDNQESDGDITYYFVGANPGEAGQREISVNVGILRSSHFSKAGLLYGFEDDPRSYFMFTVDSLATVRLEYRSPNGWEERISSTIAGLDPENVTLSIREDGNQISLLVNGQEQSSIGNDRMGRGGVGIVAVGIGSYGFQGFDVNVEGSANAVPANEVPGNAVPGNEGLVQDQNEVAVNAEVIASRSGSVDNTSSAKKSSRDGNLPDGVWHVRAVEIIDKQGFNQPIRAASALIPADWSFDGNVHWIGNGCLKGTHIVFDAISPDGLSNISQLPMLNIAWTQIGSHNNCLSLRADRAEAMVQPIVDQSMQNAKIVQMERSAQRTAQNKQLYFKGSGGHQAWSDHIIATVDHDRGGKRNRAVVSLDTRHTQTFLPMYDGPTEMLIAAALPRIFSAPLEQFENYELELGLIMRTYRIDPQWQARMNKHGKTIADDNLDSQRKIGEINRRASAEIAKINAGAYAASSASNDKNHRRMLEMLTETQTVQGSTGPVNVPAGTVWQTNDGSMYVSQNSAFNPNDLGVTAKKLQPVQ